MRLLAVLIGLSVFLTTTIFAQNITIKMYKTSKKNQGVAIGVVRAKDTPSGLLLMPHLKNLSPGLHGFHIHQGHSCKNAGMAAGGHLDPKKTHKHLGPYRQGHLGDLPVLLVNKHGVALKPVIAPRLTVADIKGRTLMIHAGGDNYKDTPKKLGGGGKRVACGVIN